MKNRNLPRNAALSLWLLGTFCVSSMAFAQAPLDGTKPAHWRVIWTSDPATSATISWSTAEQGSKHTVQYQVKGNDTNDDTKGVQAAESGRYTSGNIELYYHHARLTDLEPATAYEIQMQSDDEKSPTFYFVTAPAKDRSFSIFHGGDSRSDQSARRMMNSLMAELVTESHANDDQADDILALAHGGDYIASGPRLDHWIRWLSDHELTTGADGRLLPIIPARGNHDKGKPFNQVFGFDEEDLNYYAINIGPQVRFVTLNTETSTAGTQAKWLETQLKDSRPRHRWVLAQYHRPSYPAVKSPGTGLQSWVPLFEKYNVDLVCEADGHNIKRTVPIRDNKQDETGIVYIGEGGLGVPQRTPKTERWYLQKPGMASKNHHVFVLTFTPTGLNGKCVLEDKSVGDTFKRPVRDLKEK